MKCIGMVAGLVIVALLVVSCEWGEADLADGTPEKRKLMERKSMSATASSSRMTV